MIYLPNGFNALAERSSETVFFCTGWEEQEKTINKLKRNKR
jgi:hypothetical protein